MFSKYRVFIHFLFLLVVISSKEVVGFKCYECSSFIDANCGTTWGFGGQEGDKYLNECEDTAGGCKKLEYEEPLSGTVMVTRSCYNVSSNTDNPTSFTPVGCHTMSMGESCYCIPEDDTTPCNGQARVVPLFLQYMGVVISLCFAYFVMIL